MTDASRRPSPAGSAPGVASYFDEALLAHERAAIFGRGPRYLGHRLAVPEPGDYYALPQEGEGRVLVHTPGGIELVSNVCRHRQAIICRGRGSLRANSTAPGGAIVCPIHRWTYSPGGTLLAAPQFGHDPCLNLTNYPLQEWNGLLFEQGARSVGADLAALGRAADLDFTGYALDHVELHECDYNWKTFIEVYLEDYHVEPFHPGLGQFVACDDLSWQFGDRYSLQTVGVNNALAKPGTKIYERWHKAVLAYYGGKAPSHGAIWLTIYPNIMVEWYAHVLIVSSVIPRGVDRTTNIVEFYYPEDIALFEREFVEAEQAAYMETSAEDHEIALRMDAGRRALYKLGRNETGPYQSPMEDGMQHFHEFLQRQLAALADGAEGN